MPIPKLVVTVGLMAAQMALGAMRKTEGPRLDELDVTLAEYGTPLPRFWGIRRFEGAPIIWAEKLREQKKKSKGKAGKYAEYKYYGTWAVAVADCPNGPIDAVSRIWLDKHPVYQMTGEGPVASLMSAIFDPESRNSIKLNSKNLAIYLGSDTQSPDPRIEAWCEDRYGPDSCPAYRQTAYIVFKDIPLEKFGNRIPQVTVEAISVAEPAWLYEDVLKADADWNKPVLSKDAQRLIIGDQYEFQIWDVGTRSFLYSGALPDYPNDTGTPNIWTIDSVGRIWSVSSRITPGNQWYLNYWSADGTSGPLATYPINDVNGDSYSISALQTLQTSVGDYILMVGDNDAFGVSTGAAPTLYFPNELTGSAWIPLFGAVDSDGVPWVIGQLAAVTTFYNLFEGTYFTATLSGTPTGDFAAYHYADDEDDHFLLFTSLGTFLVERGGAHTVTGPIASGGGDVSEVLRSTPPNRASLYFTNGVSQIIEVSCKTGTNIRTLATGSWVGDLVGSDNGIFDGVNNAWLVYDANLSGSGTAGLRWYYIDRIASAGVTLEQIVDDVSGWCQVSGQDASALDQVIKGTSVTPGTGREMIEHLLDAHDSICRPHDYTVQFIKRSTSSVGTIAVEDFVREGDEPRYTVDITQDTDLPQKITINFADEGKDQQTNTVIARRHNGSVDSAREDTLDFTTYVGTPDDMQKLADRYLRRKWNSKATISNALTAQYLAAEPGDVYDLDLDDILWTAELERLTFSGGALKCEWRRTFPSLNALGSGTGAEMGGRDPDTIFIPGPTKGIFLDIPLVTDAHSTDNPLFYYGAGGYGLSFPGAAVYEADEIDDDYSEVASVASSDAMTWGYTTDTLGDANPNLWDRGNSVNVKTYGDTLTSYTEADINADPTINMAALHNPLSGLTELFNFTTATLEADGTYTLSGLLRGRRGTEGAIGSHSVGDEFVLVSDLARDTRGLSEVGEDYFFKAQSYGRDPEGASPVEVDFTGASLKPYAPARLKVVYDGTDLDCEIIRRTRVGGAWTGGSTIPLSENSEAYEVEVYVSAVLKRTITVTGTNLFTYTAAMATADGITLPTQPTFMVYQMSDAVGRGFALAA